MGEIVFFVAGHTCHRETLHKVDTLLTVAVDSVVDSAVVVLAVDINMDNIRTYKHLVCHLHDLILTIFVEDNHLINIRAVE